MQQGGTDAGRSGEASAFRHAPQSRQRPEAGYRVTIGLPEGGFFDTEAGPQRRNGK